MDQLKVEPEKKEPQNADADNISMITGNMTNAQPKEKSKIASTDTMEKVDVKKMKIPSILSMDRLSIRIQLDL